MVTAAAGAGIGAAVVRRRCLEEGAEPSCSATPTSAGWPRPRRRWPREFGADRVASLPCDVTDEAAGQRAARRAVERFGRIDVMVNNAGLGGTASVLEMTDEQWSRVLDVTLTGTFRCTRAALRQMVAQGQRRRDRQQRLGDRLAGPGGPGALRRGQGRA